jgi:hypothetical protein
MAAQLRMRSGTRHPLQPAHHGRGDNGVDRITGTAVIYPASNPLAAPTAARAHS